ncbi:MAG TPA: hydrogenase maturation nickel metallochaperone HypA [Bryobacteraceae bacterium]
MHELGIANSVLEAVQTEAARHPSAVVRRVAVTVGELAGVDPEALAFSFEAMTAGTEWQHLVLEIQTRPRLNRCPACELTFRVIDYQFACPECGAFETESTGGDELELAYLEMEEP